MASTCPPSRPLTHTITLTSCTNSCFGRWDLGSFPLSDLHPTDFSRTLFPGQDYNNARHEDFVEVDKWAANNTSRAEVPRMPWHDVHSMIVGPSVLDVAQHFVERWNFICHLKYRHKSRYPLLAFPHIDGLNDGITRHPHFERLKEEGRHYFCHHREPGEDGAYPPPVGGTGTKGTTRVQVLRSSSDWSHGIHPTEASIQTAYCQMITEAKSFVMISNQFFIAGTGVDAKSPVQNLVGQAIVQRVLRAAKEGKRFKVVILIPAIPGFAGDLKGNSGTLAILGAQYMSLCRGGNSIFELIQREGVDPGAYIEVYNLRSFDRLNYDPQRIKRMEEASGVTLFQAQAALARCVAASASPLSRALAVDRPDPLRPRAQGLPRLGRARVRAREEQGRQVCHPAGRRRGADARRQGQEGQAGQAQPDRRRAAPGVVRGGVGDHPPL